MQPAGVQVSDLGFIPVLAIKADWGPAYWASLPDLFRWISIMAVYSEPKATCLNLLMSQMDSHQALQLVFTSPTAPLVSLIVLSFDKEGANWTVGEHAYNELI